MNGNERKFAVVTGASSGIGYHLARLCAENGYDLLIAADQPEIHRAAQDFRALGAEVDAIEVDLATIEGVDRLYAGVHGRRIDALLANAGHGLGRSFLSQEFDEILHVIDTNITGTVYLLHKVVRDMRTHNAGKILITGSIAGRFEGPYQAVYHGTKAFIDSFATSLRGELKNTDITVTLLEPGATETEFFERADMLDTEIAQKKKDDPADVAKQGFDAMLKGDHNVVAGWKNKLQNQMSGAMSADMRAEMQRKLNEPEADKEAEKAAKAAAKQQR